MVHALVESNILEVNISSIVEGGFFSRFNEHEGMTKKEWAKAKGMQLLFGWECSPGWKKFAVWVELFIMDAFVDLFITLCIVVNTSFMAIDHHGMDPNLEHVLVNGNYVRN